MVPEAKVTFWDTKTLSCPEAWQVEVAARALQGGLAAGPDFQNAGKDRQKCEGIYTLDTLKYLIHGGRISHLKGLLASVLHIRPVIGVDKEDGKYYTLGQERTDEKGAAENRRYHCRAVPGRHARCACSFCTARTRRRLEILREQMISRFECHWTPTVTVGADSGRAYRRRAWLA